MEWLEGHIIGNKKKGKKVESDEITKFKGRKADQVKPCRLLQGLRL